MKFHIHQCKFRCDLSVFRYRKTYQRFDTVFLSFRLMSVLNSMSTLTFFRFAARVFNGAGSFAPGYQSLGCIFGLTIPHSFVPFMVLEGASIVRKTKVAFTDLLVRREVVIRMAAK